MLKLAVAGECTYSETAATGRRSMQQPSLNLHRLMTLQTRLQRALMLERTPSGWAMDPSDFEQSMLLTTMVTVDSVAQSVGTLAAFVGSEVRGVVGPSDTIPFGPHAGMKTFDLTIFSKANGEKVSFQFADGDSKVHHLSETREAMKDGVFGSAVAPLMLSKRVQ